MSDKSTPEHYGLRPNIGSRVAVIDIGSNSVRLVVYEKMDGTQLLFLMNGRIASSARSLMTLVI